MGFNEVFKSLQDLFPQIDARILRAVAFEHSKDVDAAVVAVVEEIIPFFAQKSETNRSLTGKGIETSSKVDSDDDMYNDVDDETHDTVNKVSETIPGEIKGNSVEQSDDDMFNDDCDETRDTVNKVSETIPGEIKGNSVEQSDDLNSQSEPLLSVNESGFSTCQIQGAGDHEAVKSTSVNSCIENGVETSSEIIPCLNPESIQTENVDVNDRLDLDQKNEDLDCNIGKDLGLYKWIAYKMKSSADGENVDSCASVAIHGQSPSLLEDSSIKSVELPEMQGSMLESHVQVSLSPDHATSIVGTESESTSDDTFTQSRQIQMIDALGEIIADARNNKKTLFSSMESVISLMKEVENKEEAAELAKEEAVMGGKDILDKTEELNKILQHTKAANDKHAGEVYGEKAILATELKELQSRLLSLSDERDKSLVVLNEMQRALEVRLAAAENEIKCAEQEKLENENCARKALAEQELIMEKVVEESKILKQQAEENAKLQEFLLDRGGVVDILQGEIAVICQDVSLLKEKFDERVPFSRSVSSSQTSCILASSTSSTKSLLLEQMVPVPSEVASPETPNIDPTSSSYQPVPKDGASKNEDESEDKALKDVRKALQDDGWDFFDDQDLEA